MSVVIGVDIGGAYIKAGRVDKQGRILSVCKLNTEAEKGRKAVIGNILNAIEKAGGNSKEISKEVTGIGVAIAGLVDRTSGIAIRTPNLPLSNVKLAEIIIKRFSKKVKIENDANCFALAESKIGAAKNKGYLNKSKPKYVLCLTLGTGVGSAFLINGKLYTGKGNALELGHTVINFNGPKCRCNNAGCVEEYISARGLLRLAKENGINAEDTLELYNMAKAENKKAKVVFEKYGMLIGLVLANFVNAFDPDIIIIGGKLSNAWRFFYKAMNREMRKRCFIPACSVVKSKIKYAGVVGAGILVRNQKDD